MTRENLEIGLKLADKFDDLKRDKERVIQDVKKALYSSLNNVSYDEFKVVIEKAEEVFDHKLNAIQKEFDNL